MSCKFRSTVLSLPVLCERLRSCGFLVSSYGIRHCTLVFFFVFSSLELFGHWYLFWSDVVASAFTGTRFPGVLGFRHLEVCNSPWSLRGSRGYAPHGYMGLMAGHAACCTQYTRCCPFGPCTGAVHGETGHNRWGVVETTTPCEDTRGGP